jgi:hypothetical protein
MINKTPEQLDLEDFDVQVEAARESLASGYYALARAELRGAMLAIDVAERRKVFIESVREAYGAHDQSRD